MFPCTNRNTNIYEFGSLVNRFSEQRELYREDDFQKYQRTWQMSERYWCPNKSMLTQITAECCRFVSTIFIVCLLLLQGF